MLQDAKTVSSCTKKMLVMPNNKMKVVTFSVKVQEMILISFESKNIQSAHKPHTKLS